jgi:hypothetical protein
LTNLSKYRVGGESNDFNPQSSHPENENLVEKIKAEIKKRAEAKARRMLLKMPKRQMKR